MIFPKSKISCFSKAGDFLLYESTCVFVTVFGGKTPPNAQEN